MINCNAKTASNTQCKRPATCYVSCAVCKTHSNFYCTQHGRAIYDAAWDQHANEDDQDICDLTWFDGEEFDDPDDFFDWVNPEPEYVDEEDSLRRVLLHD